MTEVLALTKTVVQYRGRGGRDIRHKPGPGANNFFTSHSCKRWTVADASYSYPVCVVEVIDAVQ